jgi:hypothetical protein
MRKAYLFTEITVMRNDNDRTVLSAPVTQSLCKSINATNIKVLSSNKKKEIK